MINIITYGKASFGLRLLRLLRGRSGWLSFGIPLPPRGGEEQ